MGRQDLKRSKGNPQKEATSRGSNEPRETTETRMSRDRPRAKGSHGGEPRAGPVQAPRRRTAKRSSRRPAVYGPRICSGSWRATICGRESGRRGIGTYREAIYTQRRGSYPACAKPQPMVQCGGGILTGD
uniref:Uncharacterized protein n=1 Tax=Knipowitschia caucasica TaxID=637954 RepID=A0AAV2L333_KNICA